MTAATSRPRPLPQTAVSWEHRFDLLEERFREFGSSDRGVMYSLAGRTFSVAAGSADAEAWFVRPLCHLAEAAEHEASLEIRVGSGRAPELDALWDGVAERGESGAAVVRPRLLLGDGRNLVGGLWPDAGMLGLLHRRRRKALLWARDVDRIAPADAATLFRSIVAWWLTGSTFVVAHAAAVAGRQGAVLLVGRGGSGKSSTAVACLEAGLSFLGDDSVLCHGAAANAFSLSRCASLFEDDLARHHPSLSRAASGRSGSDGKVFVDLSSIGPQLITKSAPLCALVCLTFGDGRARLEPVPRARVLTALAPSSLFNVPGLDPSALGGMASLARRLDAYELTLSGDRSHAAGLLRHLLDGPGQS